MLTLDALNDLDGVRHGFLTRAGGVSEGAFASLNCGYGSGDDKARVAENRRRALARAELTGAKLLTLYQIHSPDVTTVDEPWEGSGPRRDAMVARRPGLALGILTADCAPVLFAEPSGVIGAAHAGWRGVLAGVLEATVAAMTRLGAQPGRIAAVIGPCIQQPSYEVGPEFPAPFLAQDAANERFFEPAPRAGHFLFDLPGLAAARLAAQGLAAIEVSPADTCAEAARFFSYRRAALGGEPHYGRLLSLIALEV